MKTFILECVKIEMISNLFFVERIGLNLATQPKRRTTTNEHKKITFNTEEKSLKELSYVNLIKSHTLSDGQGIFDFIFSKSFLMSFWNFSLNF
jgi:hypothetical protein